MKTIDVWGLHNRKHTVTDADMEYILRKGEAFMPIVEESGEVTTMHLMTGQTAPKYGPLHRYLYDAPPRLGWLDLIERSLGIQEGK